MPHPQYAHMAAALVDVPAGFALDRLTDAGFIGGWALGSMGLQPVGGGVWRGTSLFDGAESHIEIHPQPALGLIDFAVGSAESRSPRIFLRVTSGPLLGHGADCCLVTLHALRPAQATAERWARTCTTHETEILLIKAQLEAALAGMTP